MTRDGRVWTSHLAGQCDSRRAFAWLCRTDMLAASVRRVAPQRSAWADKNFGKRQDCISAGALSLTKQRIAEVMRRTDAVRGRPGRAGGGCAAAACGAGLRAAPAGAPRLLVRAAAAPLRRKRPVRGAHGRGAQHDAAAARRRGDPEGPLGGRARRVTPGDPDAWVCAAQPQPGRHASGPRGRPCRVSDPGSRPWRAMGYRRQRRRPPRRGRGEGARDTSAWWAGGHAGARPRRGGRYAHILLTVGSAQGLGCYSADRRDVLGAAAAVCAHTVCCRRRICPDIGQCTEEPRKGRRHGRKSRAAHRGSR